MKLTEEINIKTILFNKYNSLGKLCATTQKIKILDCIVNTTLAKIVPDIARHCRISGLKDNCLTIETTRSEYITTLRFNTQELLYELRQRPELYMLITIKFKINPESRNPMSNSQSHEVNQKDRGIRKTNRPNQTAKAHLAKISEEITNLELKEALQKLLKL